MTDQVNEQAVAPETTKYLLIVGGADTLGFDFLKNVVKAANWGAVPCDKTLPKMSFPHLLHMYLETSEVPVPTPSIRVFEAESKKEVFAVFAAKEAASFSLDVDDEVNTNPALNGDIAWTKEQLAEMDYGTQFKEVMAAAGVGGKKREKMTADYLAKADELVAAAKEGVVIPPAEEVEEEDENNEDK